MCALIQTESAFNTYAMRYEDGAMRGLAIETWAKQNGITKATEAIAQKCSWGLGQVLGSTARWLGFEDSLPELTVPEVGIFWCAEAFERLGAKYDDAQSKIAAYNAGSAKRVSNDRFVNQGYVDKVLKHMELKYG